MQIRESDERYTPERVIDVVREFFGGTIHLDPCTTAWNPTQALDHCTLGSADPSRRDGLGVQWHGNVWCNPPYSRGQLVRWVRKAVEAVEAPECEVLMLLPSDLGSQAGQRAAKAANGLCFLSGRLTFAGPSGIPDAAAKQSSIVVYFGERQGAFERIFGRLGVVWIR
jgi:DNA N-6-adenine-methyltransferase (Dam)